MKKDGTAFVIKTVIFWRVFSFFVLGAVYLSKEMKLSKVLITGLLFPALAMATSLFVRGYWVA